MPSVTLSVEADAVGSATGIGAGAGNHLPVGSYGGQDYRAAMRFPQPAGWTAWTDITKATLTFYISDHQHVAPKNSSIYLSRMTAATLWTKSAGTQNCESGFSASNNTQYEELDSTSTDRMTFSSGSTANAAKSIVVTAMVKAYWNANTSKIVFIFDNNGSDQYTELWSDEKSGYNATLVIDYVDQLPPTAPTLGSPADGLTTADDTPTFTWTHSDPQGDVQASAQWQLYTSAGVAIGSPVTIAGATASYTPAALTRGTTYKWSVRTADAAVGYGPYATLKTFTVKALPVVTIENVRYMEMSGGLPRLRVKWTVASGVQYKYRVTAPGYDSGLLTSTTQSHLLSTLALVNGTAVSITVYVETNDSPVLSDTDVRSFTPRWGLTVHRRDLGAAPASWGTPVVTQTVPAGATLLIEYGSSATATTTPSPNTWYSSLSGVPKARYVFYRAWFIPNATAAPSLDKIVIPSSTSVEVVDKWSYSGGLGWDIDTSEYVYGSRSIHNTVIGAGPYIAGSTAIQVRAGRSYILTGLMKTVGDPGAQIRLVDQLGAIPTNAEGQSIAVSAPADTDWFTPDGRDVNRYKTPVWVSPSDQTVSVYLRVGNAAAIGSQAWFDAIKLEESTVATPWSPAAVGAAIVDAAGVQIDGSEGGIFRYRATNAGVRDIVEGGATGLIFGADTIVESPVAEMLRVRGAMRVRRTNETDEAFGTHEAASSTLRFQIRADGMIIWGPTTGTADVNLYRAGINTLKTDDVLDAAGVTVRGPLILPRAATITALAATPITITNAAVAVTTSGAVVSTAAPTIPDGIDGQLLTIVYVGSGSWQIRDESLLAGSNVKLLGTGTTYTMNDRDVLCLIFISSSGAWLEVSRSVNA